MTPGDGACWPPQRWRISGLGANFARTVGDSHLRRPQRAMHPAATPAVRPPPRLCVLCVLCGHCPSAAAARGVQMCTWTHTNTPMDTPTHPHTRLHASVYSRTPVRRRIGGPRAQKLAARTAGPRGILDPTNSRTSAWPGNRRGRSLWGSVLCFADTLSIPAPARPVKRAGGGYLKTGAGFLSL